jgi:hypothetical protein
LAAALTAREWTGRILGQTKSVTAPLKTVWLATGNNLAFRRTLARRIVPIDLDAGVEAPEDRTGFRYPDLLAHVREHRPEYVTAGLTLLRGFHLAGRPVHAGPRMGSYEAWDDLIRSAVMWAGLNDPATTEEGKGRGRVRAQADDDVETYGALLEELVKVYPDGQQWQSAEVMQRAEGDDLHGRRLRTALDVAAPSKGGHATGRSLGYLLRDLAGRPMGGLVLRHKKRLWWVERVGGGP